MYEALFDDGGPSKECNQSVEEVGVIQPVGLQKLEDTPTTKAGGYKKTCKHLALDRTWYAGFCCGILSDDGVEEFRQSDEYTGVIEHLFAQQDPYEVDRGFFDNHFKHGFERAKEVRE